MASTKSSWGESGSDALVISMGAIPQKAIEIKVTAYSPVGGSRRKGGTSDGVEDFVHVGGGRRGGANSDGMVLRLYKEIAGGWVQIDSSYNPSTMQVYGTAKPEIFAEDEPHISFKATGGRFAAWWISTQSAEGNPSPINPPGSASPSTASTNTEEVTDSFSWSGSQAVGHAQLIVYICVPVIAVCIIVLGVLRYLFARIVPTPSTPSPPIRTPKLANATHPHPQPHARPRPDHDETQSLDRA